MYSFTNKPTAIFIRVKPQDAKSFMQAVGNIKALPGDKKHIAGQWRIMKPISYEVALSIRKMAGHISTEGYKNIEHDIQMAIIGEQKRISRTAEIKQGFLLQDYPVKTQPWYHQRQAFTYMVEMRNGLIWSGMGTGKSKMVIDFLDCALAGHAIIVCPKSVIPVWLKQYAIHGRDRLKLVALSGKIAVRAKRIAEEIKDCTKRVVFITNYDSIWRGELGTGILNRAWDTVICDEVHRIKSHGSQVSKFMAKLAKNTRCRFGLSGTPIPNGPKDAFAICRFLRPELFGLSYTRFLGKYANIGPFARTQVISYKNLDQFNEQFSRCALHIENTDLELPEKLFSDVLIQLSPATRRIYDDMSRHMVAELGDGETVTVDMILAKIQKLMQVTGGFMYVPLERPDEPDLSDKPRKVCRHISDDKLEALLDILDDTLEPVVVMCGYIENINSIRANLGEPVCEISSRRNEYREFVDGKARILLATITAAAEGIDLTRCGDKPCARMIFFSVPYIPAASYDQAIKRIHRPGQKNNCHYIRLIANNSIDELVYKSFDEKRDLVEMIRDALNSGKLR